MDFIKSYQTFSAELARILWIWDNFHIQQTTLTDNPLLGFGYRHKAYRYHQSQTSYLPADGACYYLSKIL